MKKLIAAFAFLATGLFSPAFAAIETVKFVYEADFVDASMVSGTGLDTGSLFKAIATFDTSQIVDDTVFIPSDGSAGSFTLNFGNFIFTEANDLLGGPEIRLPGNLGDFAWLAFETLFTIVSGEGAGEYLLSFSGTQFQVTPSGNTVDFKMTGLVVPEPSTIALLAIAAFGLVGAGSRRRKSAIATA